MIHQDKYVPMFSPEAAEAYLNNLGYKEEMWADMSLDDESFNHEIKLMARLALRGKSVCVNNLPNECFGNDMHAKQRKKHFINSLG